jgi:hypothetical protein
MPRSGAVTLSDVIDPKLTLARAQCQRKDVYGVAKLLAKHGDAKLPDLRRFLTNDCPKRQSTDVANRCQALFGPTELQRGQPTWWRNDFRATPVFSPSRVAASGSRGQGRPRIQPLPGGPLFKSRSTAA